MRRRPHRREEGAETLELVASLPLLALVTALILQGIVLVRQQVQAEADARQVARAAVVCGPVLLPGARLRLVDPAAADAGAVVQVDRLGDSGMTRVTVSLVPDPVVGGLGTALARFSPRAATTMHDEPC